MTEPTTGSDTTQLKTRAVRHGDVYVVNGQKVWTSRALHSDLMLLLARTTPVDQVKAAPTGSPLPGRPARGQGQRHRHPPDQGDDQPQHDRGVHRESEVPADNLIGEEGKGFRYILDGMNAERILVAQECIGDGRWLLKKAVDYANERRCSAARSARTRPSSFRSRAPNASSKPPT